MLIYNGTRAVASQHHPLLATLSGYTLNIYETPPTQSQHLEYAHIIHQITLDPAFAADLRSISFSIPSPQSSAGPRILLVSPTIVHVYSALPEIEPFHASILNAASPSTALQSANFLSEDEVILVPELAPRITIRNLTTGLGIELRDVKHAGLGGPLATKAAPRTSGYSIRAKSGHVAFLTRPSVGKDLVVVLGPKKLGADEIGSHGTRNVEIEFPTTTSDALGLSFSPDGAWIAVWDTPSAKSNFVSNSDLSASAVHIYTATGVHYKQCEDSSVSGRSDLSLGAETLQWLTDGRLAIATVDGCVLILAAETFEREAIVRHPKAFETESDDCSIYVEQIIADSNIRSYSVAMLPAAPPGKSSKSTSEGSALPRGITHLAFSADGLYLASVCAHTPTTVHITALENNNIRTNTVLIHHASVQVVEWHPTKAGWLLIRTSQERSSTTETVYTWSSNLPEPMVVTASLPNTGTVRTSSLESRGFSSAPASTQVSWLVPPQESSTDAIPDLLFSFSTGTISVSALSLEQSSLDTTILDVQLEDDTPTRLPLTSSHKLTEKTPIKGHGWEPAFDQSFEDLKAESLAQSLGGSVVDSGFSPIKFDAAEWRRRQFMGDPDTEQDDTFVGKGR